MPVHALWSGPRSRSTAFLRSMIERKDILVLHEPLEMLVFLGPLDVEGQRFTSPSELIDWLLEADHPTGVFIKETVNRPVLDLVLERHDFLSQARHGFLIRKPEDIAISWYALEQDMRIQETGIEALYELYCAIEGAGSDAPVVVDSDDLVSKPEATMAAYCDAVGLPFVADSLRWESGVRPEWAGTPRWHHDVSASTHFAERHHPDRERLRKHPEVVRFVTHHQRFYELLKAQRLGPK